MSQLPSVAGASPLPDRPLDDASAVNQLQLDDFLNLLIAELQNQDPLNPLDNAQMLQQISQIREVGATDRLTETLDAVLLGQNVASATGLIGKEVRALTDDGRTVVGTVDRISIHDGKPELSINTDPRALLDPAAGSLEAGTYRYKVVFQGDSGGDVAVELGPITTTGVQGLDRAIRLFNLPETHGTKAIYRTDSSGQGKYHLINFLGDGSVTEYTDTLASSDLPATTLTTDPPRHFGGGRFSAAMANVSEVRSQRR